MKVNGIIKGLQEIKADYPNLTNDEVLKIMLIKVLIEGKR